jgi:hypothetical protein
MHTSPTKPGISGSIKNAMDWRAWQLDREATDSKMKLFQNFSFWNSFLGFTGENRV